MKMRIQPSPTLRGTVLLPASKSICNRALIISSLGRTRRGQSGMQAACRPQNLSDCDDTRVMRQALDTLPETVDIMAAGTAMRFLSAYFCVHEGTHILTGTERMKNRPIGILVEALRSLGARVEYVEKEGYPPLRITGGTHRGGHITLPGNVSSQYVSALLMIGPVLAEGLRLTLTGEIVSRPYIEMTLRIMRHYGAQAEWMAADSIAVQPTGYTPKPYYVENDWSAASYWYEMVALSPDRDAAVELPGLFAESLQGDAAVKDLFRELGVETTFHHTPEGMPAVCLRKGGSVASGLTYDFAQQPDLAQTLVATCCAMNVPFHFTGLHSLKIKETDRILALRTELGKLDYTIDEARHGELAYGGTPSGLPPQTQPTIDTYEDHRMAMCLAPLALRRGVLHMNHPEVVSKSYPTFWNDLENVGFLLEKNV